MWMSDFWEANCHFPLPESELIRLSSLWLPYSCHSGRGNIRNEYLTTLLTNVHNLWMLPAPCPRFFFILQWRVGKGGQETKRVHFSPLCLRPLKIPAKSAVSCARPGTSAQTRACTASHHKTLHQYSCLHRWNDDFCKSLRNVQVSHTTVPIDCFVC